MKKHHRRFAPLLLPLITSGLLASCVVTAYEGPGLTTSNRSRHAVYNTLPSNYAGDAYYYNGRYYSGGRYQTGRYIDRGQSYSNRYYHNGQYYYGGNYQNHNNNEVHYDQPHNREHQNGYDNSSSRSPSYHVDERPSYHHKDKPHGKSTRNIIR